MSASTSKSPENSDTEKKNVDNENDHKFAEEGGSTKEGSMAKGPVKNTEKIKEIDRIRSESDKETIQTQKVDKKSKDNVMTSGKKNASVAHVSVPENKDEQQSSHKDPDKNFLESMDIAERGYITRLRPESAAECPALSQYQIRPAVEEKFKALTVKEIIHTVLNDELGGKSYSEAEAKIWSQAIAHTVRIKVKELGFSRYKFVVQCVLGEEHGAGVKIGSRCLWDADTDNYASDTFLNETIFCMTAVYAIFFY